MECEGKRKLFNIIARQYVGFIINIFKSQIYNSVPTENLQIK